jgi:hypothetical protein
MSTGEFLLLAIGVPAGLAGGIALVFLTLRWLFGKR